MTIKQLSVFLENKTGRINDVTRILGKHQINMHAFSMAETTDFGILRLIVSEVDKAVEILREENFAVMLTEVVCIKCSNKAGALSTCEGKTLIPRMMSISSLRPTIRPMRTEVRPHAHSPS